MARLRPRRIEPFAKFQEGSISPKVFRPGRLQQLHPGHVSVHEEILGPVEVTVRGNPVQGGRAMAARKGLARFGQDDQLGGMFEGADHPRAEVNVHGVAVPGRGVGRLFWIRRGTDAQLRDSHVGVKLIPPMDVGRRVGDRQEPVEVVRVGLKREAQLAQVVLAQADERARPPPEANAGSNSAARTTMIAMTTSSSMSVKAPFLPAELICCSACIRVPFTPASASRCVRRPVGGPGLRETNRGSQPV